MDVAVPRLVVGSAEFVEGDVLAGDVLDDVRAGHEHVPLVADCDHEIGLDRRVDRATGALAEDDRDLRHHPGEQFVAPPQLGVPGQRRDGILDAGATGVVDADDRAADHGDPFHQPGDLAPEHLPHRPAEHGLVVGEHPDGASVDRAVPGHHAVAVERVRVARGSGQCADLQEAARIEQRVDAGAGAGDAALVALGGGCRPAGLGGELELRSQFGQQLSRRLIGHGPGSRFPPG